MKLRPAILASTTLFCLALSGAIVLRGAAAQNESPVQNAPHMKWLLNGPALAELATDPTAARFLDNAQPFVLQRKNDASVPARWNAIPIRSFTSYANLKRAFDNDAIDSTVRGILYDNEGWKFTPPEEQRDPAGFMKMSAQLVHDHRLLFLTAPAVDLTRTLAPGPEKRYEAYLRLRLAADAARYADVYDIQAQGSERDVARYSSFVKRAADQARSANANIIVLAGISTNPSGQRVTSDDVISAINATRSFVDGYWLNIPKPSEYCPNCNDFRPDIAIDVFQKLGSAVPVTAPGN